MVGCRWRWAAIALAGWIGCTAAAQAAVVRLQQEVRGVFGIACSGFWIPDRLPGGEGPRWARLTATLTLLAAPESLLADGVLTPCSGEVRTPDGGFAVIPSETFLTRSVSSFSPDTARVVNQLGTGPIALRDLVDGLRFETRAMVDCPLEISCISQSLRFFAFLPGGLESRLRIDIQAGFNRVRATPVPPALALLPAALLALAGLRRRRISRSGQATRA